MSDIKQKASDFFKYKPTAPEVHATSDGVLFEQKQHATAHAQTLEDQQVITMKNSGETDPEGGKEVEIETLTVPQLQELAKEMQLPEEEWKALKKAELVEYIASKKAE